MQLPVQITFRNITGTEALKQHIHEEAMRLDDFYPRIMACRVLIELPHQHRQRGQRFHIRIDLTVPGSEIVVNHEPTLHQSVKALAGERRTKEQEVLAPHKDVQVAIRDAFRAARRQLQDYAHKQRRDIKHHEPLPQARVSRLFPEEGYGFLEMPDGTEIYFHKNSLLNEDFEKITLNTIVTCVVEQGDQGPQASTVRITNRIQEAIL